MLRAGHRLGFVPAAVVRHSHERSVWYELRADLRGAPAASVRSSVSRRCRPPGSWCGRSVQRCRCTSGSRPVNARDGRALSRTPSGSPSRGRSASTWAPSPFATDASSCKSGASDADPAGCPRLSSRRRVGGTEVYTHDLAVALASDPAASTVFVLAREADPQRPDGRDAPRRSRAVSPSIRVNNTFRSCTSFEDTYRNPTVLRAAASIVSEIRGLTSSTSIT